MLLAIDPGANTGWALFDSARRLHSCGLGTPEVTGNLDEILIECPVLRPRGEKNPNDILKVARNAGEWAGRFWSQGLVLYLSPNQWKGSTSKKIDHQRTYSRLSPEEIKVLTIGCSDLSPRSAALVDAVRVGLSEADKRANVLDAIGIGLFGVGR